jgi:hypothetical protein
MTSFVVKPPRRLAEVRSRPLVLIAHVPKALIGPGRLSVSVWAVGPGGLPLESGSDTNIDLLINR